MSLEEAASWLLRFAHHNPSQAKNAYSALLLIPGWEQIRFTAGIRQAKKLWETSGEKYGDFWDADHLLEKLKRCPLDWNDVSAVRDRAILVLRLFHLCRSIDLARALRARSVLSNQVYWKLQRKGMKFAKWEALMTLPDRALSPVHLLSAYVRMTSHQGKGGGSVFEPEPPLFPFEC